MLGIQPLVFGGVYNWCDWMSRDEKAVLGRYMPWLMRVEAFPLPYVKDPDMS